MVALLISGASSWDPCCVFCCCRRRRRKKKSRAAAIRTAAPTTEPMTAPAMPPLPILWELVCVDEGDDGDDGVSLNRAARDFELKPLDGEVVVAFPVAL